MKTKDGVKVSEDRMKCISMILANCSIPQQEDLGIDTFFNELTHKFIEALTWEEIQIFVTHNVTLKLIEKISTNN